MWTGPSGTHPASAVGAAPSATSIGSEACHSPGLPLLQPEHADKDTAETAGLTRNILSSKFLPYVMAHRLCQPALDRLIHHRFPRSIARGTVSEESFTRYLVQDYLFLVRLLSSQPALQH